MMLSLNVGPTQAVGVLRTGRPRRQDRVLADLGPDPERQMTAGRPPNGLAEPREHGARRRRSGHRAQQRDAEQDRPDERRGRVARQAQERAIASRARQHPEARRCARLHPDRADELADAERGGGAAHVVVPADRHAAAGDEHVARGRPQGGERRVGIVADVCDVDRTAAGGSEQRREGHAVDVVDPAVRQRHPGRGHLVAGHQHGDRRGAPHVDGRHAQSGERGEQARVQRRPGADDDVAGREVLAGAPDVVPRGDGGAQHELAP